MILRRDGVADFDRLHSRRHDGEVQRLGFDLLELDGADLHAEPLDRRKAAIAKLLRQSQGGTPGCARADTHVPPLRHDRRSQLETCERLPMPRVLNLRGRNGIVPEGAVYIGARSELRRRPIWQGSPPRSCIQAADLTPFRRPGRSDGAQADDTRQARPPMAHLVDWRRDQIYGRVQATDAESAIAKAMKEFRIEPARRSSGSSRSPVE